jgi:hypothetical protein
MTEADREKLYHLAADLEKDADHADHHEYALDCEAKARLLRNLLAAEERYREALERIAGTVMSMCFSFSDLAQRQHTIARTALEKRDDA